MPLTPVLTARWDADQPWTIETYESLDGYKALPKALRSTPDELIELVKNSNLRGRGGAGFPTGLKWSFVPQGTEGPGAKPKYLVINADEGEPGTCRDLPLMMRDPHALIEGCIIAAYAIRANFCAIYVRGEAIHAIRRVRSAVREARAKGYLGTNILDSGFDLEIEETALLESLEGRRVQPRLKPPFPAVAGLYASPTVVNNVGTIASVPGIVLAGSDWYKEMGPEKCPGTSIYSLSGRVQNPGQYEAPMGTTLRELLEMAGGIREGHTLKFWTPGGSSTPCFTDEHLDVPLDFDSVAAAGSMNGTSAVMIFDDSDSNVTATRKWIEFYAHESCGKCTPCREGNYWLAQILTRVEKGEAVESEIDQILDITESIGGRSFCALADGGVACVQASIKYFRDEYLEHVRSGGAREIDEGAQTAEKAIVAPGVR